MNVNLTPELEKLVHAKVESGLYNSNSEVVREALRLLVQQDEIRRQESGRLAVALAEGLAQADRGESVDGKKVVDELRELLQRRRG